MSAQGQSALCILALLLASVLATAGAEESIFTVRIEAGQVECFSVTARSGTILESEWQVVSGGQLDIDVTITNPAGELIEKKERVADGLFEYESHTTGDFQVSTARHLPVWIRWQ